ncbi:hypothetical protein B0H14DRAFT_2398468, partial [Mycena olivaceomarginata]
GGYEFLMQNYKDGDRICIFGFSRGAHIARSLAGMLHRVGLLPVDNHEQVPFAYRMYSRVDPKDPDWEQVAFSRHVEIEFIGVWDIVDSVGLIPKRLPVTPSNNIIRTFRHAVSLDEHRAKFQANMWNFPNEKEKKLGTHTPQETPSLQPKVPQSDWALPMVRMLKHFRRSSEPEVDDMEQMNFETNVLEVYFAGCHCALDVGGGSVINPKRPSLARIPLRWMIRECFEAKTGMMFNTQRLQELGLDPTKLYKDEDGYLRFPQKRPPHPRRLEDPPHARDGCKGAPGTEEEEDLKDALSPIHDPLTLNPFWWILEVIPFTFRRQSRPDNNWHTRFRSALFRASYLV